ncbi:hypothetical protein THARTR1_06217 [Trichoderma harzianum]|uniref:Uncharacterized protein n=1 Tax=Trichoderma harzianum TaxID=5544 RepID=A0A2K0U6V6_TRIHA|nr:hypothetical protein THARTR1_06217 [Trichoderma harzianum]
MSVPWLVLPPDTCFPEASTLSSQRPNEISSHSANYIMNKDSCFTYVHMHRSGDADLFEDFCKDKLPDDEIYVPPQHRPINPEDEDDVVPDQHAAFGIQRATQRVKEPAWKDLGLSDLMRKGPGPESKAAGPSRAPKGLPR